MAFIIRCRVSGGVTGTRESICKGAGGAVLEFTARAAADAEASRLNASRNSPYATALFSYWVEER